MWHSDFWGIGVHSEAIAMSSRCQDPLSLAIGPRGPTEQRQQIQPWPAGSATRVALAKKQRDSGMPRGFAQLSGSR